VGDFDDRNAGISSVGESVLNVPSVIANTRLGARHGHAEHRDQIHEQTVHVVNLVCKVHWLRDAGWL
jgi:hypothetical protein